MTTSFSPIDVVLAVASGVSRLIVGGLDLPERELQLDALAALYAPQTDVRHPFAPLGDTPLRSRAELRRHFADGPGRAVGVERFEATGVRAHRTEDHEVAVVEFSYTGTVGGRTFTVPCVFVTRVRDGVIVESRDYVDHVGMARVFGYVESLASQLTDS